VSDTKDRLRRAAIETVRDAGIAHTSARAIAGRADANQALIFYHFGSVHGLLAEACLQATHEQLAQWGPRLEATTSVPELVALAHELHAVEQARGNVAVLAQMLAGAQTDPQLREPTAAALGLWITEVRRTLHRLLDGSPLADLVDLDELARSVAAAFVGTELLDGLEDGRTRTSLVGIDQLATLVEVVLDLGPIASTTLRRRVERTNRRSDGPPRTPPGDAGS
jgi:AcrR family transcriptional regulator